MWVYLTGFILTFLFSSNTLLEDFTDTYGKPIPVKKSDVIVPLFFSVIWPITLIIVIVTLFQKLKKHNK